MTLTQEILRYSSVCNIKPDPIITISNELLKELDRCANLEPIAVASAKNTKLVVHETKNYRRKSRPILFMPNIMDIYEYCTQFEEDY